MYNGDAGHLAGKSYLIFGSSLGSTTSIDLSQADAVSPVKMQEMKLEELYLWQKM